MIVVSLMGNLGNQMFIYAAARSYQLATGEKMVIDLSSLKTGYYTASYQLGDFCLDNNNLDFGTEHIRPKDRRRFFRKRRYFHLKQYVFKRLRKNAQMPESICRKYYEKGYLFNFNRDYLGFPNNLNGDKYLYGYFQSQKYFSNFESVIKSDFKLKTGYSEHDKSLVSLMKENNSVGISIRVLKAPENSKVKDNLKLGIVEKDFYYRAIETMKEKVKNPLFFVFADDIDLAKKEMLFPKGTIFVEQHNASYQVNLLSECKHFIITNSTFSWWGAFLGNYSEKIIVMPSPWDRFGSYRKDIYIDGCIKLDASFMEE